MVRHALLEGYLRSGSREPVHVVWVPYSRHSALKGVTYAVNSVCSANVLAGTITPLARDSGWQEGRSKG